MIEETTKKRLRGSGERLAVTIFIISIFSTTLISNSLSNIRQEVFAQIHQPSTVQHFTKVSAGMSNTTAATMPSMTSGLNNSAVPHMTNMNMMGMMMNMMNMMNMMMNMPATSSNAGTMNMPATSSNAGTMNMTGSMPRSQGSNMNNMM